MPTLNITPLDAARVMTTPAGPSDDANAIAEALWGIAAAITESKPKPFTVTQRITDEEVAEGEEVAKALGFKPKDPDAFRPALELLPIGAVAELDEPIVLDGPKAKAYCIPSGTAITRVVKYRHALADGHGSGFELYEGTAPWSGTTDILLEAGISARDFSVPKGELEVDEVEDMIHEPDHYKLDGRECIEFVRSLPFVWGNVVKYVWRFRHKNGLEDLHKARRYLEIAREEGISRPESRENYEFFLKLFYGHDSADEVGEQRLYVLCQIFIPWAYEHETETVETELERLIRLVEEAA